MPPRRDRGMKSDEDSADESVERRTTSIMITEQQLEAIVTNIARSQAETNQLLIENIMASHRGSFSDVSTSVPAKSRLGSFAKCTARFDGTAATGFDEADVLEPFINAVQTYKECTNVRDEHALKGLPMLLTGNAAIRWRSVKSSTATWDDALRHQPKEEHKFTKNCDLRPASDAELMKVDTSLLTSREGEGTRPKNCDLRPASDAELMKVDTSLLTSREGEGTRPKNCDLRPASNAELMKVDTSLLTSREGEGTRLTADQKAQVNALLVRNADRYATEWLPTDYDKHHIEVSEKRGPVSPPYRLSQSKRLILVKQDHRTWDTHLAMTPFVGEVQPPIKEKKKRGRRRKLNKIQ